jgi:hypothetical protein
MYDNLYKKLLKLYPKQFREKFGNEILIVLNDLKRDEIREKGTVGIGFWTLHIADLTKGIFLEHTYLLQEYGIKKYFHLNGFNIMGIIFLIPIFLMLVADFSSRIIQGNLLHYNGATYNYFSHSFLYQRPVIYIWVIILPVLAIILNALSLIVKRGKHTRFLSTVFIKNNFITILILLFGFGVIFMIKFHDFLPCVINAAYSGGIRHIGPYLKTCSKA